MDKLNDLKNDFLNEFSKIQDLEGPSYLYDPSSAEGAPAWKTRQFS